MTGLKLAQMIVDHERLTREGREDPAVKPDDFIDAFEDRRAAIMTAARLLLEIDGAEPILGHDAGD